MPINQTIVGKIYAELKEKIINQQIKLNQRISIKEIAEDFGISQTPIREALNRLIKDELVEYKLRRGYYVIRLSCKDLEEIYDLRKLIEVYALEQGMMRETLDKDLFQRYLQDSIEMQKEAIEPKKPLKYCIADRELHLSIVKSSLNEKLYKIYMRMYPFVSISQQLDPLYERSLNEHILLIKAILDKNILEAKKILKTHINNCKCDGIESLKDYQ